MWYVPTHCNWTRWLQITEHIWLLYIAAINLHRWIALAFLFSSVQLIIRLNIDWFRGGNESDSLRMNFYFGICVSKFLAKICFRFAPSLEHFILIIQTEFACLLFYACKNIYYVTVVYVDCSYIFFCISLSQIGNLLILFKHAINAGGSSL